MAAAGMGEARSGTAEPVLMAIRDRASRLVLRTACEKLTPAQRKHVLGK